VTGTPVRRSDWLRRLPRGDSFAGLALLALCGAVVGAAVGALVGAALVGVGLGLVLAGCLWFALVLRAFRAEAASARTTGRHRRSRR
jgi:hypothetical protein